MKKQLIFYYWMVPVDDKMEDKLEKPYPSFDYLGDIGEKTIIDDIEYIIIDYAQEMI